MGFKTREQHNEYHRRYQQKLRAEHAKDDPARLRELANYLERNQ